MNKFYPAISRYLAPGFRHHNTYTSVHPKRIKETSASYWSHLTIGKLAKKIIKYIHNAYIYMNIWYKNISYFNLMESDHSHSIQMSPFALFIQNPNLGSTHIFPSLTLFLSPLPDSLFFHHSKVQCLGGA